MYYNHVMDIKTFRRRIEYEGDLDKLFTDVSKEYNLGRFKTFTPILL